MGRTVKTHLLLLLCVVFMLSATSTFISPVQPASALNGYDFNPGRIIDDSIFFNKNAMSASQIQEFLNAKVPGCWRDHAAYTGGSGTVYYPPFTCLKEYNENTNTKENNIGRFNSDGSPYQVPGGKSAAQIIWDAAQAHGINPQALIVILQKEQGLVTDTWPLWAQYQKAMGYACPDTAPCNESYYGFYNQVSSAAWQLRRYVTNPDGYNHKAGVTRYIAYNPSTSCGGSSIFIENSATAALYNYTPYQPNQAALNNLYGLGDGCSAYGNRNFWRMFNDWFGSTISTSHSAILNSVNVYSDSSRTVELGTSPTVAPGQKLYITVRVKNTGTQTWSQSITKLGTLDPENRASQFEDSSWLASGRAAQLIESSVAPGNTGTFQFSMTAPNQNGTYAEGFGMLAEGVMWFGPTFYLNISVSSPYNGIVTSLTTYKDALHTQPTDPQNTPISSKLYVRVAIKNTGTQTWSQSITKLGTLDPENRASQFEDSSWLASGRAAQLIESSVAPGNTGTFQFSMTAPNQNGTYAEGFGMLAEGVAWMPGVKFSLKFDLFESPMQRLKQGVRLYSGEFLTAGDYKLAMQTDGNLVLYGKGRALWSSGTAGKGKSTLIMQGDGNLVIYDVNGKSTWSSGTAGKGKSTLIMQGDGNLVIYDVNGKSTWSSGTDINVLNTSSDLPSGLELIAEGLKKALLSPSGDYKLAMQTDGNLVLYGKGRALWSSGTAGKGKSTLIMQGDGNLVIYDVNGKSTWSSGTAGKGKSTLIMQGDGNLVIYDVNGKSTWSSGTAR